MYVTNDSSTESAAFYGLFSPAPTNFITDTQEDNWEKGVEVDYAEIINKNDDKVMYASGKYLPKAKILLKKSHSFRVAF